MLDNGFVKWDYATGCWKAFKNYNQVDARYILAHHKSLNSGNMLLDVSIIPRILGLNDVAMTIILIDFMHEYILEWCKGDMTDEMFEMMTMYYDNKNRRVD